MTRLTLIWLFAVILAGIDDAAIRTKLLQDYNLEIGAALGGKLVSTAVLRSNSNFKPG